MESLSNLQISLIAVLLGERYAELKLRLKRLEPLYEKYHSSRKDVEKELELIDSILNVNMFPNCVVPFSA